MLLPEKHNAINSKQELNSLLLLHIGETKIGENLFKKHPPHDGITGLILNRFYTLHTPLFKKEFYILQWDISSCDYGNYMGTSKYIQGYFCFKDKQTRDKAFKLLTNNSN